MIDDKKIEEATRNYINKNGYFIKYDEEPCVDIEFAYREGYKEGCKDAINEFLKDLWHSNTEKPKEDSNIVYIDENDEFWDIDNYNSDNFDDSFGKGWDSACRTQNIYKWCYKEYLLPKKGDKQ